METRDAVTSLLLDDHAGEEARIAGYYCLSSGEVARDATPGQMGRRAPNPIPAVRMGRFAIDLEYQGQVWGADLLRDAPLRTVTAGELIAPCFLPVSTTRQHPLSPS